ncbi:Cytochrome bd2 [Klebsiella variicola]|uniref:Cytochrome bd2 n=1 Tax=Klebsiella variicola TaxID=244366 RepID=A0A7H4ML61_KLEVA|nr:Cytochrome bd2 [Klebsiella variicola]
MAFSALLTPFPPTVTCICPVSLLTFIVVYSAVFGVGYSYMLRLIRKGAAGGAARDNRYASPPAVRRH